MNNMLAALLAATDIQLAATALFVVAVVHIFATAVFQRQFSALAHRENNPHAGWFHYLGEAEAVFMVWSVVFIATMAAIIGFQSGGHAGQAAVVGYLRHDVQFVEPLFVFAIMVLASSRPMEVFADSIMSLIARVVTAFGVHPSVAYFWALLVIGPLLGSLITEPAAMTLVATLLVDRFFMRKQGEARESLTKVFKYAVVGTLFVNVSIGGTLTTFAAPPVVMVASVWGIDNAEVFALLGYKAALAIFFFGTVLTFVFRRQLAGIHMTVDHRGKIPAWLTIIHLLALAGVVVFSHDTVIFMSILLIMLAVMSVYRPYQHGTEKTLQLLRSALMVGIFLAGLVVLGTPQRWWLQPLLTIIPPGILYYLATGLTAVTDNAMLTYLASLVENSGEAFRYAMLAGAVTGGGLTIIANAPNMPGYAIVRVAFLNEKGEMAFNHLYLFLGALPATIVAVLAFQLLPHL